MSSLFRITDAEATAGTDRQSSDSLLKIAVPCCPQDSQSFQTRGQNSAK